MIEKRTVAKCPTSDWCEGWNAAVDAMHREWIPVDIELPFIDARHGETISDDVLCSYVAVYGDYGIPPTFDVTIGYYDSEDQCFRDSYDGKYIEVGAWMELPEPF